MISRSVSSVGFFAMASSEADYLLGDRPRQQSTLFWKPLHVGELFKLKSEVQAIGDEKGSRRHAKMCHYFDFF